MESIELGKINKLIVARQEPQGMYLRGDDPLDQVLLPNAYISEGLKIDDEIDVFVYLDNEERITATTLVPKILVNQFASLHVDQVNSNGAFMDMGIVKQLLVPYKEQIVPMEEGRTYLVYMYLDAKTERLVGTTKFHRYLGNEDVSVEVGEEVDLLILNKSDLGYNAMVNQKHTGLIFNSDVNQPLSVGQQLKGFVKTIRPDNKIDLTLQVQGVQSIEVNAQKILDVLKKSEGSLNLNDKSSPEDISRVMLMSKKAFKKGVGNLYKMKLIVIGDDGIKLV